MNELNSETTNENIDNTELLLSTLSSFEKNIEIRIKQADEKINSFNNTIKLFTKPLLKINRDLTHNLKLFIEKFKEIQLQIGIKHKFITDFSKTNNKEPLSLSFIKNECQLNNSVTQIQSKLVEEIEKINKGIDLIKNLTQSENYLAFLELNKKENSDEETVSISQEEQESEEEKEGIKKEKKLLTKKRSRIDKKGKLNMEKEYSKKKLKRVKLIGLADKKTPRYKDKDILTQLKKKYNNPYVKKVSKTFIKRRLNHKIIYEQHFTLVNGEVVDKRIKTSGDKMSYKYNRFTFILEEENPNEEFVNLMKEQFKVNYFIKETKNNFEIAGRPQEPLFDIISKIFKSKEIFEKYHIVKGSVYSYEFNEELSHEYDISDPTVQAMFEDKVLNKLIENWSMLCLVREFVANIKSKNNNLNNS